MINAIHIIGQILLGGFFIYSGLNHFLSFANYRAYAESYRIPFPGIAIGFTGVLLVLGGLGILFNIYTTIASILLVAFFIPVTFMMHDFWVETDPDVRSRQKINFTKNLAILGAILLLV